ncbi:MAG: uncharacterized protein KVP18_000686 [Porospora cf. gigantea A]|uniref:uncharacterized protein n=1 Tax=Porospora cf. gigantea A TaxID=2853593 RepID=UPI00355985A5|nr:MAG: hypothetical protein KVP18_000686 [Porospora cf. gigantea A]
MAPYSLRTPSPIQANCDFYEELEELDPATSRYRPLSEVRSLPEDLSVEADRVFVRQQKVIGG